MPRVRTIATPPGQPSEHIQFTVDEELARDTEEFAEINKSPPTDEERIDAAFPQTDVARVIFEVFFEMANEIRALQDTVNGTTQGPLTRAQFKNFMKTKLP